jgi:hypothetical protein
LLPNATNFTTKPKNDINMKTNKTFTTIISRTAMTLLLAVLTTATAWAQTVQFPIYEGDEGTEAKPYQIKTAADLNKLSEDVNSGTMYKDKYFKLMDNIYFSHSSTWNDITSEENNFNPIGREVNYRNYYFQGIFDGNDKTISGIRIYKDPQQSNSSHNGLFGRLKGTVIKLTLTDTRIIGFSYTGGIAGGCYTNSLIDHCTVTSTVAIYANQHQANYYGGIAGNAGGNTKITNNTSSATVAIKDGLGACEGYGGILGGADSGATVSNNLAIGATVKDSSGRAGAIMGYSNHGDNFTNNYYINCTVNGTANALNVGCHAADITENCAAVSLHRLTLTDGITTTTPPSVNISGTDYYGQGTVLVLNNGHDPASIPTGYTYPYIVNGESVPTANNTLVMPAADITIGLDAELVVTPWTGSGTSADDPYVILYTSQLDLLATNVNSGTTYKDTYFQLGDDLKYSHTSDWNDITSEENNFTPIGQRKNGLITQPNFQGTFDGNGHTISGIRINYSEPSVGLFGTISDGATVSGITLDDARIVGKGSVGGIVGSNSSSTVSNCTVTNRVAIHITQSGNIYGGIVGMNNYGTVTGCTSSVQMSIASDKDISANYLGGIVGRTLTANSSNPAKVTNNFVIGAIIPAAGYNRHAAITVAITSEGTDNSIYENNYYYNCTVAGVPNATNVGYSVPTGSSRATISDITENDGAVAVHKLTLANGISTSTPATFTYNEKDYYKQGATITLSTAQPTTYVGYIYGDSYIVNGTAISGDAFTMPAQDTEVTSSFTTIPVYPLTLAAGITTTVTPVISFDDTPCYLASTIITLSGGLPEVTATNEFAYYTLNGKKFIGNSFKMPAEAVIVGTDIIDFVEWAGEGTESSPYLIQSCDDLMLLAGRVNTGAKDADGQRYEDATMWYKLVADLQFDYAGLGETESNFEAIGKFSGHFLGNGHTVSGIRIRKGNKDEQGLFGHTGNAVISGVILTDADITGRGSTGGIVGNNSGTVTDCHVTSTVIIRATESRSYCHGGIVGNNLGTVSACTSAATLTIENGATYCGEYGGIAGENGRTLNDNLALGVRLPATYDIGAIIGNNYGGTPLRNYYSNFAIEPEEDYTVYGCNGRDESDNDGAVPGIALYDHSDFSGLNSQILQTADIDHPRVDLAGRTLYRDGDWNTLCLPFNVSSIGNSPLAGATVMELDVDNSYDGHKTGVEDNTLYLYFKQVNSIEAGKPYIVKWTTTAADITNPVFSNVVISSTTPTDITFTGGAFKGTYEKISYTQENKSILFIGTNNTLYWPQPNGNTYPSIGAFRAYFQLTDGTEAREFVLNFDDVETSLPQPLQKEGSQAAAWYDLSGRKIVNGKLSNGKLPKGIYIYKGNKVVIK